MSATEESQLRRKVESVEELLGRRITAVTPSPRPLGYRARIALKTDERGCLGYHRPRSHQWVEIPACTIARPELNEVLEGLPLLPDLAGAELRTDGERVVLAATQQRRGRRGPGVRERREARERLASLELSDLGLAGVALEGRPVQGECRLRFEVQGIVHRLGPVTFFQVNLEVNTSLVAAVVEAILDRAPSGVLDLYSGAGNLSLPIAAAGVPVVQVEQAQASVEDARKTAQRHGLDVTIRRADAGRFEAGDAFFDVALLDPPRAGAPGLLPQLLVTRPRMLVYVACNPQALVRDLQPAFEVGYGLERLELFDMFPQTDHVELLALLVRG